MSIYMSIIKNILDEESRCQQQKDAIKLEKLSHGNSKKKKNTEQEYYHA